MGDVLLPELDSALDSWHDLEQVFVSASLIFPDGSHVYLSLSPSELQSCCLRPDQGLSQRLLTK